VAIHYRDLHHVTVMMLAGTGFFRWASAKKLSIANGGNRARSGDTSDQDWSLESLQAAS